MSDNSTTQKILFTTPDREWHIVSIRWEVMLYDESLRVTHNVATCRGYTKPDEMLGFAAWFMDEKPECFHCGVAIPDDIQTLVKLYEWATGNLDKYSLDDGIV